MTDEEIANKLFAKWIGAPVCVECTKDIILEAIKEGRQGYISIDELEQWIDINGRFVCTEKAISKTIDRRIEKENDSP